MKTITKNFTVLMDAPGHSEKLTGRLEANWIEAEIAHITEIATCKTECIERPYFEINNVRIFNKRRKCFELDDFVKKFKVDRETIYDKLLDSIKEIDLKEVEDGDEEVLIYSTEINDHTVEASIKYAYEIRAVIDSGEFTTIKVVINERSNNLALKEAATLLPYEVTELKIIEVSKIQKVANESTIEKTTLDEFLRRCKDGLIFESIASGNRYYYDDSFENPIRFLSEKREESCPAINLDTAFNGQNSFLVLQSKTKMSK